ncbi:MAG TPA: HD-GYP domain-containing protein [Thermoleophilaceae bacterium]|nr:HD-GYP domain-containing protein [Thermoleophilaceae bacterium]
MIVLPALAVSFIETSGRPWLLLLSVLLATALSVTAATLGAALWARRPNSRDFVFADLMLWGWLRRVRAERRLAEAHQLLGHGGQDINGEALNRERCSRVLQRLVAMLETKDTDTLGHSRRVTRHAERIARDMGLSRHDVARVRIAASVHDIGKVHTPRAILTKPSKLTDEEFEVMKRHPVDGARMTAEMGDPDITAMVRHHHERLDGSGYPDGLRGDEIPLGSRIISVADTFDAITASRTYHGARAHRRALEVVAKEAGTQLDPDAVAAFLRYYSGKRAVALSAFGFTGTPRLANWMAGALNGVGAWASPLAQGFAAIVAAALASAALGGPPPKAIAASHPAFATGGEPSTPNTAGGNRAGGREGGRAEGTPRAHVAPVTDRPGNRLRDDAPVASPPGGSAPPGGSSPGDGAPSSPAVETPAVKVPHEDVPAVDLPVVDVPVVDLPVVDVPLPTVDLPLSQVVPGAQDLHVELPRLRLRLPTQPLADR